MVFVYVFVFCEAIFFFLTDALLRKAFATPSFQGYSFVSSLLVLLGLIKVRLNRFSTVYHFVMRVIQSVFPVLNAAQSEDKVKPVLVVPGHLQALEHVVRQDYFPKENVAVLQAFMSR